MNEDYKMLEEFLISYGKNIADKEGLPYNCKADKRELIKLASKEFPQTALRYIINKRRLEEMNSHKKSTISIYETLEFKLENEENFLIEKGIQKAKKESIDLYFISSEEKINVANLISLIVDDYPQVTRRYLARKEILKEYQ